MAKKSFSVTSRAPVTDAAAWKAIDVSTRFLIYELTRGGIEDAETLSVLTGRRLSPLIIQGIVDTCEQCINGPLHPHRPLRCGNCGRPLVDVPCRRCGRTRSHYKIPESSRVFSYSE